MLNPEFYLPKTLLLLLLLLLVVILIVIIIIVIVIIIIVDSLFIFCFVLIKRNAVLYRFFINNPRNHWDLFITEEVSRVLPWPSVQFKVHYIIIFFIKYWFLKYL